MLPGLLLAAGLYAGTAVAGDPAALAVDEFAAFDKVSADELGELRAADATATNDADVDTTNTITIDGSDCTDACLVGGAISMGSNTFDHASLSIFGFQTGNQGTMVNQLSVAITLD